MKFSESYGPTLVGPNGKELLGILRCPRTDRMNVAEAVAHRSIIRRCGKCSFDVYVAVEIKHETVLLCDACWTAVVAEYAKTGRPAYRGPALVERSAGHG